MDLMPVSSTSLTPTASLNGKARPWMWRNSSARKGAPPSRGSPKAFSSRPRQASETGTCTGAPVS